MSILYPPTPAWTGPVGPRSKYIILWHGCTTLDRDTIQQKGVVPSLGRADRDFGKGFYTTTLARQARHWAWIRFYDPQLRQKTGIQPVVLWFKVDRHALARLTCITFVIGDYNNQDFWALVQHCRQSTRFKVNDHAGPEQYNGNNWYDIACGPVSAFWDQRVAMRDADQISFHTQKAANLLTDLIRSNDKDKYDWGNRGRC